MYIYIYLLIVVYLYLLLCLCIIANGQIIEMLVIVRDCLKCRCCLRLPVVCFNILFVLFPFLHAPHHNSKIYISCVFCLFVALSFGKANVLAEHN